MLRSYQYTEQLYTKRNIHNTEHQDREVALAEKFVLEHQPNNHKESTCPICKGKSSNLFFTKWGVNYLICSDCGSIYALCGSEEIRNYRNYEELNSLRTSKEYQDFAKGNRSEIWDEMIDWLKFRTFRFMKRNKDLRIVDVCNRYAGFSEKIMGSDLCGKYLMTDSILSESAENIEDGSADLVFYNDQIKTEYDPDGRLNRIHSMLADDGLLLLTARAGCGFDILTLKGKNKNIYPYEHISLPSIRGFKTLLDRTGFEIMEITTPGMMDVKYVKESVNDVEEDEMFVKYLLTESNELILQEFQRFLQKSCMSSFVRILARKRA